MNNTNSKRKINRNALACFLIAICFVQFSYGQASAEDLSSALGFEQNVNDVPEAPIHFLIPLALFLGACVGIHKSKHTSIMHPKTGE